MKNLSVVSFCAASLLLSASTLRADSFSVSLSSPILPAGGAITALDLSGISPLPSQSPISGPGYSISFSGVGANEGVVNGAAGGLYAAPIAGSSAITGNYLSTGLGTITISFTSPQTSFELLWGSIDIGNSLSLNDAANDVVTGTEVQTALGGLFASNGYQGVGGSAYVLIDSSSSFTQVSLTSSVVSFESADFQAVGATPEPGSLMLVGTGLAGIAGSVYRRARRVL